MNGVGTDGSGGRNTKNQEDDILLNLEESLDWHNQTTGFVSSYTLPLSHDTASTGDGNNNLNQPIKFTRLESIESNTSSIGDVTDDDTIDDEQQHKEEVVRDIFRPPSRSPSTSPKKNDSNANNGGGISSPTEEKSGALDSTDGASNAAIKLPSPFSPSSLEHDNKSSGMRLPSPSKSSMDAIKNATIGPDKDNIYVGSSNISQILGDAVTAKLNNGSAQHDDGESQCNVANNEQQGKNNVNDIDNKSLSKDSKGGNNNKSKTKRKNKAFSSNNKQPKIKNQKRNNLVIQVQPNLSFPSSTSFYRSKSDVNGSYSNSHNNKGGSGGGSRLPPPHPLSHVQSYPQSPPIQRKLMQHDRKNSIGSMSEASSACESEATPIISPANRCHTFSFSDDESDEMGKDDNDDMHGGRKVIITRSISAMSASTSNTELRGVNISFTDGSIDGDNNDDENDFNEVQQALTSPLPATVARHVSSESESVSNDHVTNNKATPSNDVSAIHSSWLEPGSSAASSPISKYKGDTFFDSPSHSFTSATSKSTTSSSIKRHSRQLSSDENFFDAIHNSGLQSLSFEQVADEDLLTSADVEIELVYNTGSSSWGGLSDDNSMSGDGDDRSTCTEEERKEMEKRILQWRKGRELWRQNTDAKSLNDHDNNGEHQTGEDTVDDNYNDDMTSDYDDVELAPIRTPSSSKVAHVMNHIHNAGGGEKDHLHNRVGEIKLGSSSSSSNFGWRWKNPMVAIRNHIWRWNLMQPYSYDYSVLPSPVLQELSTPKASNVTPPSPPIMFADDNYNDDDEEEGSESKGLTSPIKAHNVDFDRDYNCCSRCCFCWKCFDYDRNYRYSDGSGATWQIHSGWKKLLFISSMFFVIAWIFTNGHLEKHHNNSQYGSSYNDLYGGIENDPLSRDHFVERIHIIDDGDDFYWSDMLVSPVDDDDDFHGELFPRNNPSQYYTIEEENAPASDDGSYNDNQDHHAISSLHNEYSGIDTIVVLGLDDLHPNIEWLTDRLQMLYPDMKVMSGFPKDDGKSSEVLSDRALRRFTRVIDPTKDNDVTISNLHILVVCVFMNPYDWVELMRVDNGGEGIEWKEFVETETSSGTILDLRAKAIESVVVKSAEHDGIKLVIPFRYEDLVESYTNFDNYVRTEALDKSSSLPGIVGLLDEIQARTGLHPDDLAGWKEQSKANNQFWADPIGCSGHICLPSINKMRNNAEFIQYINNNANWSAEKLVGYQKKSAPKPKVDQIVVLGERHSGGEWLVDRLSRCFPNTPVKYGLTRPGKWFQSEPVEPIPQTLVISVFLNPFDWIELMRQRPINAPAHKDMEWADFLTSPWERKRSDLDEALTDTKNANCSYGFYFEEIIPCMTKRDPQNPNFPLYELHPLGGGPYSSLLELRADKIRNFLNVANFDGVIDFIHMRYEDLVWDEEYTDDATYLSLPFPGIAGLLEKIRDQTSLTPDASAGWISDEDGFFKAEQLGVGATNLDPYYLQWMDDHVDWDVEKMVGYSPF